MPRSIFPPRARAIGAAVLAAALLPPSSSAQSAPPSAAAPAAVSLPARRAADPAFPATPVGRLGRTLIDAINGGDSAAIALFVRDHLGHDARGRSPEAFVRMFRQARAQSGGLDVERLRMDGPELHVMTKARNGRRWLGFALQEPERTDSARLANVLLIPFDDPGMRRPPAPWATGALTDDQAAAVIRDRVRQAADSDRFSGVVLVARGDRVLVHEALGFADRERKRGNTRETTFAGMSVGKMFAGVAVAQLVERGLLRWDDTLANVLPEYPNRDAARRITIRQLLTHTAGVPEPFLSPRFAANRDDATHAELLATFADAPLTMTPGAVHAYSNGNYVALAAIVEKLSGLSYEQYLRRNVWGPSGMRAVEHPAWTGRPREAVGYARFSEFDPLGIEPRRPASARSRRGTVRGFGGGAYTAEDMFRFVRALRAGKLLRADLVDSVVTGRIDTGDGPDVRYGFGFYEQRMNGERVVGHPGSNPDTGHDADVETVWDGDWTVVVLSNYDAPAGVQLSFPIVRLLAQQSALAKGGAAGSR